MRCLSCKVPPNLKTRALHKTGAVIRLLLPSQSGATGRPQKGRNMAVGVVGVSLSVCLGCLAMVTEGFVAPVSPRAGRGRLPPSRQRRAAGSLTMIIPNKEWGYVIEDINDHPEYFANMNVPGESKPGATRDAFPADELPLDTFEHGGAFESDFHDLPYLDRPCYVEMKKFIDNEGLTLLPSEAELLEQDIMLDRKKRARARKERDLDEADEDLVDDTLEDVPIETDEEVAPLAADTPPPPVDFEDNDGYDDGYDTPDDSTLGGDSDIESSALF